MLCPKSIGDSVIGCTQHKLKLFNRPSIFLPKRLKLKEKKKQTYTRYFNYITQCIFTFHKNNHRHQNQQCHSHVFYFFFLLFQVQNLSKCSGQSSVELSLEAVCCKANLRLFIYSSKRAAVTCCLYGGLFTLLSRKKPGLLFRWPILITIQQKKIFFFCERVWICP